MALCKLMPACPRCTFRSQFWCWFVIVVFNSGLLRAQSGAAGSHPRFLETKAASSGFELKFDPGGPFNARLESSTDLRTWLAIYTFPSTAAGATLQHTDAALPRTPVRYYRVSQLSVTNALAGDHLPTADGDVVVHPVNHASLVLAWKDQVIYCDPVGGAALYRSFPRPTLVLVTDIHTDHMDSVTLNGIGATNATILAPLAVFQQLSSGLRGVTRVLTNTASAEVAGVRVDAVPMYNLTPARLSYHSKGRGNGYVITLGGKRLYVSGDTEDIPEMRALRDIDVAFVCMNLPFTMDINQAASAVRDFRPGIIYPYHYSSSDVVRFKQLIGDETGTEVRLRKWY